MDIWESLARTLGAGRAEMLLDAMIMTIRLSLGATILGVIIGSVVVVFNLSSFNIKIGKNRFKPLRAIARVYLSIIRGTPVVTQLLIINATIFANVRGVTIWVGIVALGINSGAYVAEIIRAGIQSIDKGQMEAALSLGFNKRQAMFYVILPQAIKNILPTFVNEFIVLIKETAVVGFVGIQDINRVGQLIMSRTFDVTPLFVTAGMYWVLVVVLTTLLGFLENKLRSSDTR